MRDMKEADKNFILATFLRGLYYGNYWWNDVPKQIFMDNYKIVAEELLQQSMVKVACLKEDSDIILGYSILSTDFQVIHWVFVKSSWRQKGIAKNLLPKYPSAVTHLTKLGLKLLSKYENTVYNPFKILNKRRQ